MERKEIVKIRFTIKAIKINRVKWMYVVTCKKQNLNKYLKIQTKPKQTTTKKNLTNQKTTQNQVVSAVLQQKEPGINPS